MENVKELKRIQTKNFREWLMSILPVRNEEFGTTKPFESEPVTLCYGEDVVLDAIWVSMDNYAEIKISCEHNKRDYEFLVNGECSVNEVKCFDWIKAMVATIKHKNEKAVERINCLNIFALEIIKL